MPEPRSGTEQNWAAHLERERSRYRDGESRLPSTEDADARQRQLTRLGNAAGGAGLSLLMQGRPDEAADWFHRAAARYRESFADAPPEQLGPADRGDQVPRPRRRLAGRRGSGALGARRRRRGQRRARSAATPPRSRCSSSATTSTRACTPTRSARRDDFPADVGDALAYLAAQDVVGYIEAIEDVLESFEAREDYLEDLPVADTVLVLQALARRRGIEVELSSPLLPLVLEVDRRRRVEHRRDHDRRL